MKKLLIYKSKLYIPVYLLLALLTGKNLAEQFNLLFVFTSCLFLDVILTKHIILKK